MLGVGAAVTLAAWNDSENATGSFGASVFDTESQSAGSPTYASNVTTPGASLTFAATGMSPGTSYYAWLNIRTTTTTTVAGNVTLSGIANNAGGLVGALQYRAVRMATANPGTTCGSGVFSTGTPVFLAGAAGTYLPVTQVPAVPIVSSIAAAGAQIGICFEVRVSTAAANSYQGQNATVTWTFTAVSVS